MSGMLSTSNHKNIHVYTTNSMDNLDKLSTSVSIIHIDTNSLSQNIKNLLASNLLVLKIPVCFDF